MTHFSSFGLSHATAIALTIAVAIGLSLWARRVPSHRRALRLSLAAFVGLSGAVYVAVEAAVGVSWRVYAPLHLCDLAVFVAVVALLTERQLPFELLFYWGLTGTLLALVTPDLAEDFPHHRFVFYFAQHGSLVIAAVFLVLGLGMRPSRGSVVRAWLWLNAVGLVVGVIDFALSCNFLFLRHKPEADTPLSWFGPWPWYIVVCEGIALGMFGLLWLVARRPSDGGDGNNGVRGDGALGARPIHDLE